MFDSRWIKRFDDLAATISGWSRDPSTKVGCVIVRPDKTIASVGYNGFPRGVRDTAERYEDRETKYKMVVHGETNAIVSAREPLHGYALFCHPFPPCADCAKLIIQAGIAAVFAPTPTDEERLRWGDSMNIAVEMFDEAGVELSLIPRRQS